MNNLPKAWAVSQQMFLFHMCMLAFFVKAVHLFDRSRFLELCVICEKLVIYRWLAMV